MRSAGMFNYQFSSRCLNKCSSKTILLNVQTQIHTAQIKSDYSSFDNRYWLTGRGYFHVYFILCRHSLDGQTFLIVIKTIQVLINVCSFFVYFPGQSWTSPSSIRMREREAKLAAAACLFLFAWFYASRPFFICILCFFFVYFVVYTPTKAIFNRIVQSKSTEKKKHWQKKME